MGIDAAQNPESTPVGPCTLTGRLLEAHPGVAGAVGASMWVLAVALLTVYARHDIHLGAMDFMLGECWMVGLGCVGQPMLSLYVAGREPTVRACERAAIGAYTAAGVVTVLLAAGQLQVDVLTAAFVLILPLAFGIQSGNAAQALARRAADRAQARAEGEEAGWLACAVHIGQVHEAHDAKVQALIQNAESTAELRYDLAAFERAINSRHTRRTVTPLRAVNGTNGATREGRQA